MEKMIWEFYLSQKEGWVRVHSDNLDSEGNLTGEALKAKNEGLFQYRQVPFHENGTPKLLLEPIDFDYSQYQK